VDAWVADRGKPPEPREGVSGMTRCVGGIGREENNVKNPLDSLEGTVICGFLITIVLYIIVKMTEGVAS
jgi:hypothetical protein